MPISYDKLNDAMQSIKHYVCKLAINFMYVTFLGTSPFMTRALSLDSHFLLVHLNEGQGCQHNFEHIIQIINYDHV